MMRRLSLASACLCLLATVHVLGQRIDILVTLEWSVQNMTRGER
jgi:hypothetical protein